MLYISKRFQLVLMTMVVVAYAQNTLNIHPEKKIWFDPPEVLLLPEGSVVNITWVTTLQGITQVKYHVDDEFVSTVTSPNEEFKLITSENTLNLYKYNNDSNNTTTTKKYTYTGSFEANANFIGYNKISVTLYNASNEVVGIGQVKMTVSLSYQKLNDIFTIAITLMVVILYITMGATLDLDVVVQIVKEPIGPVIGLVCQYLSMPLIGFLIGLLLFPDDPLLRLGLFISGCSPGGGGSNIWTHLLGASLDLSIMMTFVSTVMSFAFIPLWVLTVGPFILRETEFIIPYKHLAMIVVIIVVPCGIGLAIQQFAPRVGKFLKWLMTPFCIFCIIFTNTFGIYSYRYCFLIATWKMWLAGFGLPFIGYCSGALASVIFKRKPSDMIAIAIETGLQNNLIAVLLLKFTLESPAGELTVVIPAASVLMTPIPLIVALLMKKGYEWQKNRKQLEMTNNDADVTKNRKQLEMTNNDADVTKNEVSRKDPSMGYVPCSDIYPPFSNNSHGGISNPAVDLSDEIPDTCPNTVT